MFLSPEKGTSVTSDEAASNGDVFPYKLYKLLVVLVVLVDSKSGTIVPQQ